MIARSLAALAIGVLSGCSSTGSGDPLAGGDSMLKLRSAQTRSFETADRTRMLRGVVATLQDMGFMVTGADVALGTVSGRRFTTSGNAPIQEMRLTVTVRPRDERHVLVRANAEFNSKPVEDAVAYQNFFNALSRTVFLAANQAD